MLWTETSDNFTYFPSNNLLLKLRNINVCLDSDFVVVIPSKPPSSTLAALPKLLTGTAVTLCFQSSRCGYNWVTARNSHWTGTEGDLMILAPLLAEGRVVKGLQGKTQGTDNTQQAPLVPLSVLEPMAPVVINRCFMHCKNNLKLISGDMSLHLFITWLLKKHYHTDYLFNINLEPKLLNYDKPQMQRSPLSVVPLSLKYQTRHLRFYVIHFV